VSRHGCTPAYPSWEELQFFLERGIRTPALRKDAELEQIHWSTNRLGDWPEMRVFAFDHRMQLEKLADELGAPHARIGAFKQLCLAAARRVAAGRHGYGILCDARLGRDALYSAAGTGLWIGRPVEDPGTRPLRLEIEPDYGSALAEWPVAHVVKALCFYHPDDDAAMKADQEATIVRLARAARANRLELLLEIIPSKVAPATDTTSAEIIQRFYDLGVHPDWWKLEPMKTDAGWANACAAITRNDPYTRGVVVLGLEAPPDELAESFQVAARHELVKGFAVGRTIFADAARAWLAGAITDAEAVEDMAARYRRLCRIWDEARARKGAAA
jgi:5-dehydro-2-deoxygluconokinase